MTKHTPATPLPLYNVAVSAETNPRQFIEYAGIAALSYDDAVYIAHAANAYPKLVEALCGALDEIAPFGPLTAGSSIAEKRAKAIRALLRSLGEID